MKRILIFLPLLLLFIACDKKFIDIQPETITEDQYKISGNVDYFFNTFKLNPKYKTNIDTITGYTTISDYLLLLGKKNKNSWFSKFDNSGEEIFSYELKNASDFLGIAPEFTDVSFRYTSEDRGVVKATVPHNLGEDYQLNPPRTAYLLLIDFKNGNELNRIKSDNNYCMYLVCKIPNSYLAVKYFFNEEISH
jgi:hypothetical protein